MWQQEDDVHNIHYGQSSSVLWNSHQPLLEDAAVMADILKIKAFYEDEATSKSTWHGDSCTQVLSAFPVGQGQYRGFELGPECRWLRMNCECACGHLS